MQRANLHPSSLPDEAHVATSLARLASAHAKATVEAAVSRRDVLVGFAATSATAVTVSAPDVSEAAGLAPAPARENPDLLQAYDDLKAARIELTEAENALEWLIDEWKHLWPFAPEELLGNANAHKHGTEGAERDIAGRFLMRDTIDLTMRLAAKFRMENQRTCFAVLTSSMAKRAIEEWQGHVPKGRTEKALSRNRAYREKTISEYQKKLKLALDYEAETSRLREASGVELAKQRINDAKIRLSQAAHQVSIIPSFTFDGLRIKAEALKMSGAYETMLVFDGMLGDAARFIQSVLNMRKEIA